MSTSIAPSTAGRAWLGLAVLAPLALLMSMDLFVMLLAVPHIGASMHADAVTSKGAM